jgi:hypothetical protein
MKTKSTRPYARENLRVWKQYLSCILDVWAPSRPAQIFDPELENAQGTQISAGWRPRRPEEYPENDTATCTRTADQLRTLARAALSVADELDRHAEELAGDKVTLKCGCPLHVVRGEGHQEGCRWSGAGGRRTA